MNHELARHLPPERFGVIHEMTPMLAGMSGAPFFDWSRRTGSRRRSSWWMRTRRSRCRAGSGRRARPGFLEWALPLADYFERCDRVLAADQRRALSHNDLNPGNILWDGERVWLVDWDVSTLSHRYYDLAALSGFLNLGEADALALLGAQEGAEISPEQAETFRVLRRLASILHGVVFLSLVPDMTTVVPTSAEAAPTLAQFYAMLGSAAVDLKRAAGQALFGAALFRQALASEPTR